MNLSSSLRALAFASVCALPLPAGVLTFNFTETGGNVVVTASGSLTDKSAWSFNYGVGASSGAISAVGGGIEFGGASIYFSPVVNNTGTWTGGFGSGGPSFASSYSGSLGFAPSFGLQVPVGYDFDKPTNLSGTMTFTLASFNSLGITPVAQSAVFGGDTIQLTFSSGGGSSVPDAGPGPALALLLGGLGLRQWRSYRRARAAA